MALFNGLLQPKAVAASGVRNPAEWLIQAITGGETAAGVPVNSENAMKVSAFFAGVRLLSFIVGRLPIGVFLQGTRDRDTEHWAYRLLAKRPNHWQTPFEFKQMAFSNVIRWGNGYAEMVPGRDPMTPVSELSPLHPTRVELQRLSSGAIVAKVRREGSEIPEDIPYERLLHWRSPFADGIVGLSLLAYARETLGHALAQSNYASKQFGQGLLHKFFAQTPPGYTLDQNAKERLKLQLNEKAGLSEAGRVLVLPGGVELKPMSMSLADAQFLQQEEFTMMQLAQFLGIPPHMLELVSRSTSWGCVAPETDILRADGQGVCASDVQAGDELLAYDPDTQQYVASRVRAVGRTLKPMVKVTTARGRTIDVTVDHPFWVSECVYPTKHKEMVYGVPHWVMAGNLDPSRHAVMVALNYPVMAESAPADLAWLAGLVIGDGHVQSHRATLSITTSNAEVASRINAVAEQYMGTSVYRRPNGKNAEEIILHRSQQVREFVDRLDIRGLPAEQKRVPKWVKSASSAEVAAFLSGYLDSDGTVASSAVVWGSVSRALLADVQALLARLGVQSSLRMHRPAELKQVNGYYSQAKAMHHLKVSSKRGRAILARVLTPSEPRKARRLMAFEGLNGLQRAEGFFVYDRVKSVTPTLMRETIAIELDAPHTHVTAGLITHNTGIQEQTIGFNVFTMDPWLTQIEESIDRDMLAEEGTHYAKFNRRALLAANMRDRGAFYQQMAGLKALTPNEVRDLEDMDAVPWGDEPLPSPNESVRGEGNSDESSRRENGQARAIAEEAAGRLIRKEIAAITRMASRTASGQDAFEAAISEFYAGHADDVARDLHMDIQDALQYCQEQRDAILAHGIRIMETWESERAAELADMALGGE